METTGKLKEISATQKVSDKFQKRDFVLTTDSNTPYPQHVSFQVTQDKCAVLDQFKSGDTIKVQFNLRGREWSGPQGVKYFNTLEAWRIEKATEGTTSSTTSAADSNNSIPSEAPNTPVFNSSINDNDDLPF
jgi:hypothetical protein